MWHTVDRFLWTCLDNKSPCRVFFPSWLHQGATGSGGTNLEHFPGDWNGCTFYNCQSTATERWFGSWKYPGGAWYSGVLSLIKVLPWLTGISWKEVFQRVQYFTRCGGPSTWLASAQQGGRCTCARSCLHPCVPVDDIYFYFYLEFCRRWLLMILCSTLSLFFPWATCLRSSGKGSSLSILMWSLPRVTEITRASSDHPVLVNNLMTKHICCFASVYGGASDVISSQLASATVLCTHFMYTIFEPNSSKRTLHLIAYCDVAVEFLHSRFL